MTTRHQHRVRAALQHLATASTAAEAYVTPLPPLLHTPYLIAFWALLLLIGIVALALGRVHLPYAVNGVVVAMNDAANPTEHQTLLLLPAASHGEVRAGTVVTVDTGELHPDTMSVTSVEPQLLDERTGRARFASPAGLLPHLDSPRAVAHVACQSSRCLTPDAGIGYRATAVLGSRTIASYVMPRS